MNFDDNATFRRPEILKLRDSMRKSQQKLKQATDLVYKAEWINWMYG